jgi:hypothetical protein
MTRDELLECKTVAELFDFDPSQKLATPVYFREATRTRLARKGNESRKFGQLEQMNFQSEAGSITPFRPHPRGIADWPRLFEVLCISAFERIRNCSIHFPSKSKCIVLSSTTNRLPTPNFQIKHLFSPNPKCQQHSSSLSGVVGPFT